MINLEVPAGGQGLMLISGLIHFWFKVIEVDTLQRFSDVEGPQFTVQSDSVPIEGAVGCIRVLLDFEDQHAGSNGMQASRGNDDGLSGTGAHGVHRLIDGSFPDGGFELFTGYPVPETQVESGVRESFRDVPHLRLGFAAQSGSD